MLFETPGEHLENEVKYFRRQTSNNIDIDGEYGGLNINDRNHLVGKQPKINYEDYGTYPFSSSTS